MACGLTIFLKPSTCLRYPLPQPIPERQGLGHESLLGHGQLQPLSHGQGVGGAHQRAGHGGSSSVLPGAGGAMLSLAARFLTSPTSPVYPTPTHQYPGKVFLGTAHVGGVLVRIDGQIHVVRPKLRPGYR